MYDEMEKQLGEKLCAAFVSQMMGIGLEYTLKKYVQSRADKIDQSWYALARALIECRLKDH